MDFIVDCIIGNLVNTNIISKSIYKFIPIFGIALKIVGTIFIDRRNSDEAKRILMIEGRKCIEKNVNKFCELIN